MDDLLKRMVEVERQAAGIVAQAQAEAQRLLDDSRRQAVLEGQRLRAELAEETRRLLADRVAQAELERAAALTAATERLQVRAQRFAADVRSQAEHLLRELAYPLGA